MNISFIEIVFALPIFAVVVFSMLALCLVWQELIKAKNEGGDQ